MSPVPVETFATLYESTLSSGITNVATAIPVTTRTGAPQSGQFRLLIQDTETDKTNREIVLVTAGFGAGAGSFTATRGVEGTAAVAHGAGSYVADVQTGEAIRRFVPSYLRQPRHNKLLAWSFPPEQASQAGNPLAGLGYYVKVFVPETLTFANVWTVLNQGSAAGIANTFLGLYSKTGTRKGVTADLSAAWQTSGVKSQALVVDAGQNLTVVGGEDEYCYVGLLIGTQGTTPATLFRAMTGASFANVGLQGGTDPLNYGTTGSALTALPTTFVPATQLSIAPAWWVGLS